MCRIISAIIVIFVLSFGFACGGNTTGSNTPIDGYKQLYAAVKSKDTEAIKSHLTKKTIEFGAMAAARNNTPLDKMYENGFTGSTFSATLPTIRDERVKDNMGAIEVWNSEKSEWEDLPFVLEDGSWKLAVGELFAGSYKSPGKGRDEREKEAANIVKPPAITTSNTNANAKPPGLANTPTGAPSTKK